MILLTPFVVCRMWSSTEGTFCRGVAGLSACNAVVMSSAFDTIKWLVAIFTGVPVLLTPYTLRYVWFGRTWEFYMNEFVLDDLQFVDVFVVGGWFKVYEEYVEGFFCLPMFDIDCFPHILP